MITKWNLSCLLSCASEIKRDIGTIGKTCLRYVIVLFVACPSSCSSVPHLFQDSFTGSAITSPLLPKAFVILTDTPSLIEQLLSDGLLVGFFSLLFGAFALPSFLLAFAVVLCLLRWILFCGFLPRLPSSHDVPAALLSLV